MSDRWVGTPTHMPRRCHRTGTSNEDVGPYFEHDWGYYDADPNAAANGELRHQTLYQSAEWLRYMLSREGSPFAPITTAEYQQMKEEIQSLTDRVEALVGENDDLRADLLVARENEMHLSDEDLDRIASKIRPAAPRAKKAAA